MKLIKMNPKWNDVYYSEGVLILCKQCSLVKANFGF